jgi:hypothetical protein
MKNLKTKFKIWYSQKLLNIGANLLRKGMLYQVGQPVHLPAGYGPALNSAKTRVNRTKSVTYWVQNIFFDFKENKLKFSWSNKPIRGFSEKFMKKNEQKR